MFRRDQLLEGRRRGGYARLVVVAEHGPKEANEQLDLVCPEQILVEDFESSCQEADSLGPCDRVAAFALVLARGSCAVIVPWGYPELD